VLEKINKYIKHGNLLPSIRGMQKPRTDQGIRFYQDSRYTSLKMEGFCFISVGTDRMMKEHIMGDNDATTAPFPSHGFGWDRTLMNSTRVIFPGRIPDGDVHHYAANKSNLVR
jgi:hypothetical protein